MQNQETLFRQVVMHGSFDIELQQEREAHQLKRTLFAGSLHRHSRRWLSV